MTKRWGVRVLGFLVGILLLPGLALAKLAPPQFMPGFPMVAGPQLMVMWMPVPGAVKYHVYLNGEKVAESGAVQHFMPAPEKSGSYKFQVAGVGPDGAEGELSGPGVVKIIKLEPPEQLRARVLAGRVSLAWNSAEGAILYNVYRSAEKGKKGSLVASLTTTRYVDPVPKPGETYYYTVGAKDRSGAESAPSAEYAFTMPEKKARGTGGVAKLQVAPWITKMAWQAVDNEYAESGLKYHMLEPNDVALDEAGGVAYVSVSNSGVIAALDMRTGDLLHEFGAREEGDENTDGWLIRPKGIAFADGLVYVADDKRRDVQVFDGDGTFSQAIPMKQMDVDTDGDGVNDMQSPPEPRDVAVSKAGEVYVLDYRNGMILVYDSRGRFDRAMLKVGKEEGNLAWPIFITWADPEQTELVVVNAGHSKISFVDPNEGKVVRQWGQKMAAVGGFGFVAGIALDHDRGLAFVGDTESKVIQVFEAKTGKYKYTLAGDSKDYPLPIVAPFGLALDGKGALYIPQGMVRKTAKFILREQPPASGE